MFTVSRVDSIAIRKLVYPHNRRAMIFISDIDKFGHIFVVECGRCTLLVGDSEKSIYYTPLLQQLANAATAVSSSSMLVDGDGGKCSSFVVSIALSEPELIRKLRCVDLMA